MGDLHLSTILAESNSLQISKCSCCSRYNLNYRNLFVDFSKKEFRLFQKMLESLKPLNYTVSHPEGLKAVIGNAKSNYHMAFTATEVQHILIKINQALILESAFDLLRGNDSQL